MIAVASLLARPSRLPACILAWTFFTGTCRTHDLKLVRCRSLDFPRALGGSNKWIRLKACNLHHRNIRVQNCGCYFLDPPSALGHKVGWLFLACFWHKTYAGVPAQRREILCALLPPARTRVDSQTMETPALPTTTLV